MSNSSVSDPNADASSLIEHRFVICYAYYSIAAATEHGSILFLANPELLNGLLILKKPISLSVRKKQNK